MLKFKIYINWSFKNTLEYYRYSFDEVQLFILFF